MRPPIGQGRLPRSASVRRDPKYWYWGFCPFSTFSTIVMFLVCTTTCPASIVSDAAMHNAINSCFFIVNGNTFRISLRMQK